MSFNIVTESQFKRRFCIANHILSVKILKFENDCVANNSSNVVTLYYSFLKKSFAVPILLSSSVSLYALSDSMFRTSMSRMRNAMFHFYLETKHKGKKSIVI